jgi:general secretion pathway protein A
MRENTRVDFTLATSTGRSAFLTYEPYYGLKEKPFSLSADPRFLYKSRTHAQTFDDLRAGIRRREGLIVLTGEPGTGKTTLCRSVLETLDRKTFCTFVPDPFVSREDLLKMLLLDFGVMSVEDLKSGRLNGASRPELSYPLFDFLKSLVPLQAYAVLIIDEAQNLAPQLLEEIRILADLEAPEKLLQLVLVGQPELRGKLKDSAMRQVDQRVSVRAELLPLDRDGVGEYIAHRLRVAGDGTDRVTFSDDAADVIHRGTRGNPRLINLVCDKSLHHGHAGRTFVIGPEIAARALAELGVAGLTPAAPEVAVEQSQAHAPAPTPVPVPVPVPVPELVAVPPPAQKDDFGLGEKFFERPHPVVEIGGALDDDTEAVDEDEAPMLFGADRAAQSGKRRTVLIVLCLVLAPALIAAAIWWWQQQQISGNITLPALPAPPARASILRELIPPAPPELLELPDVGGFPFEVGVGLFTGFDRANGLAVELAAAGFRATTRSLDSPKGRMFEVRTGPYMSREAADADAGRIRQMPGYADARVVAVQPVAQ